MYLPGVCADQMVVIQEPLRRARHTATKPHGSHQKIVGSIDRELAFAQARDQLVPVNWRARPAVLPREFAHKPGPAVARKQLTSVVG
jgi:hypothetical protein